VAITFGPHTSDKTLIAYRLDGQDWQFTNVTINATHLLVSPSTPGIDLTTPINPSTFELRVTNWACKWLEGSVLSCQSSAIKYLVFRTDLASN